MLGFDKTVKPKNKLKVKTMSTKNIDIVKKLEGKNNIVKLPEDNKLFRKFPPILFKYQQDFIKAARKSENKCLVWEKSRRIGATHGLASYAVLQASKEGGNNFYYIGTNLGMAREFIDSCAYWTRNLNLAASEIEEAIIEDEKDDILTLRITFKSGKKIEALSSKPSSIRGRQGDICLDEVAFLEDSLEEFLKAVLSMNIWGNKVFLISTHNGEDNQFNELVESIKKGEKPYYLQKTTFREAVNQGLYERICLVSKDSWSLEKQKSWLEDIYHQYGDNASEELDVIPKSNNPNAVFKRDYFKKISKDELPKSWDVLGRFWDFAATEKDTSFYSVGVLLGIKNNKKYILDWAYCRKNPGDSEDYYFKITREDGKGVISAFELEGGSMALRYAEHLKKSLPGFRVKYVKPEGSKLLRSLPVKEAAKNGEYYILDEPWTDDFLKAICKFEGQKEPLITDTVDSLSGGHETFNRKINHLLIN